MHSTGSMNNWSDSANPPSSFFGWMQSTGQASTHAASFVPMHGSAITYAIVRLPCSLSKCAERSSATILAAPAASPANPRPLFARKLPHPRRQIHRKHPFTLRQRRVHFCRRPPPHLLHHREIHLGHTLHPRRICRDSPHKPVVHVVAALPADLELIRLR